MQLSSATVYTGRTMFYEIIRALIQKIFQDKILFALVIIGLLAIFVGGFGGGAGDRVVPSARQQKEGMKESSGPQDQDPASQADTRTKPNPSQPATPATPALTPVLAKDFISWWIGLAMDYNANTAASNHQAAFNWMTPEASQAFQSAFWTSEISNAIVAGSLHGTFTPTAITPVASNPDGSIVVQVQGHLVLHRSMQQVNADFLVRRESSGLRVAGMYNRSLSRPGSSVY